MSMSGHASRDPLRFGVDRGGDDPHVGRPPLELVVLGEPDPAALVVATGFKAQPSIRTHLFDRDDVDGVVDREVDPKQVCEPDVRGRPATVVGCVSVEQEASSPRPRGLALHSNELTSDVDDEVVRMPVAERNQDIKAAPHEGVEDRRLASDAAFCVHSDQSRSCVGRTYVRLIH
jgi:hypothetical protein